MPGATEGILDLLKERELPATFFVVGKNLADPAARRLAERARNEGHRIGNHTMHHKEPLGEYGNSEEAVKEIVDAEALIGELADPDRLFRPQGRGRTGPHLLNDAALRHLIDNRYTMVTWNNVPGDWLEPQTQWYDNALATLAGQEWSVLVLHDHCQVKMMDLLVRFFDHVDKTGIEVRRDFPADCLPIVRGELAVDPAEIVTAAAA
jgi:peptidoglycan/xylan/chitin deacetylase (PgdA/CDA1 family)